MADERVGQSGKGMKRRGLLAGAAALVAGIATKQATQPVSANQGTWTLPYTGTVSVAGDAVQITNSGANSGRAIHGTSDAFDGIAGFTNGAAGNSGVYGLANGTGTYGMHGDGNTHGYGLFGERGLIGVYGLVNSYIAPANTVAVYGNNASTTAGVIGVRGDAVSAGGFGVYGSSAGGPGVFGTTTAAQNAGLAGIVSTPGTAAFAGTSTNPSAFAGFFTGDVFVNGNFTVNDPTKKHGAIAHPDGSHRILYSMESPESWIEDFGKGTLVGGKADVRLDSDFAAVVQTDDYHVFLTPYDGVGALRVARQTATGFGVEEIGGVSNGAFRYRVVAKPKSENKAARLAKFTIPTIKVPGAGEIPLPPAPKASETPPQSAPASRPNPTAALSQQGGGPTPGSTANPAEPIPPPRSG